MPNVVLDRASRKFAIMGRSVPEDVFEFYCPILAWLEVYASKPLRKTVFDFKMEYFNTASSKLILEVMLRLEDISAEGKDVLVRWHYPDDDEDIEEAGEEYSDIVDVPFEQVPYTI